LCIGWLKVRVLKTATTVRFCGHRDSGVEPDRNPSTLTPAPLGNTHARRHGAYGRQETELSERGRELVEDLLGLGASDRSRSSGCTGGRLVAGSHRPARCGSRGWARRERSRPGARPDRHTASCEREAARVAGATWLDVCRARGAGLAARRYVGSRRQYRTSSCRASRGFRENTRSDYRRDLEQFALAGCAPVA